MVPADANLNERHASLYHATGEQQSGSIVLISSVAGIRASVLGGVAYSASKFAMASLGLTVAREVREEGVRITNVYPGEVNTPILDGRPVPVSDEHKAQILRRTLVGPVDTDVPASFLRMHDNVIVWVDEAAAS